MRSRIMRQPALKGARRSRLRGEAPSGTRRLRKSCGAQRFCALLFWGAVNGNDSHYCVDEGKSKRSAPGTARDRVRTDDGGAARGTFGSGGAREKRMFARVRFHFFEPETVWAEGGFVQV